MNESNNENASVSVMNNNGFVKQENVVNQNTLMKQLKRNLTQIENEHMKKPLEYFVNHGKLPNRFNGQIKLPVNQQPSKVFPIHSRFIT
jgi:hypothetical protein